ncbi:MAG: autotransporter-associated beta strand repeat-containing protein, partial [Planctomycetales bacterium]|nr:autotransporter-associated beta strand repeat-containing protein [Planctomycetales bacterium]
AGNWTLSGANTYTGTTTVAGGVLQLPTTGAVGGDASLGAAGTLAFTAGYNGAFTGNVSGAGGVQLDSSLTTETVTFSGAKSYGGATLIQGGTLAINNASGLGTSDGTVDSGTTVSTNGSQGSAKLALSGGINVAGELLTLFPRRGEGVVDLPHVTSSGNNSWGGNIKGDVNGDNYNIESTSGTLTLSGFLSAPDNDGGIRNFVFSGAGNTNVTGKIVDFPTNETGGVSGTPLNLENNVNVIKRGTGTLTISTATDNNDDYWFGSETNTIGSGTVIEQGTLEVVGSADNGELRSDVQVRFGATFKVNSGFTKYNLLPTSPYEVALSGGGTVVANTLGLWESNTISPGDSVGTLKVTGNMDLFYFDPDETTINNTGSLNFELGNDATVKTANNTENDLISVSGTVRIGAGGGGGNAFGSEQFVVNAIIADGVFDTNNNYTLIDAGTLTLQGGVNASNFQVNFTDSLGNVITGSRYTAAVVLDTAADEVQLNVDGTPVSLTWTGANSTAWDIQTTANWSGGDTQFANLDAVTFDDSSSTGGPQPGDFNNDGFVNAADYTLWRDNLGDADETAIGNNGDGGGITQDDYIVWRDNYGQTGGAGQVSVDISDGDVYPSVVNFTSANGTTFTVSGANGFGGGTPINVAGNATAVLANTNTLQGNISIAADATLNIGQGGGASTVSGNISGAGTLVIGGGYNPFTSANSLTGPIVINAGTLTVSNAGALGTTASPTTINSAGTLDFNFQDLAVDENLIFNGGSMRSNDSTLTLNGDITIGAGGATFQVTSTSAGTPVTTVNGDIGGVNSGPVRANVSAGVTLSVNGNISNNGLLRKTGAGTLVIGATSTIGASEIAADGGSIDVTAKSALALASGQTLSGLDGTVTGNVSASSGAVVRVGAGSLPAGPAADYIDATWGA